MEGNEKTRIRWLLENISVSISKLLRQVHRFYKHCSFRFELQSQYVHKLIMSVLAPIQLKIPNDISSCEYFSQSFKQKMLGIQNILKNQNTIAKEKLSKIIAEKQKSKMDADKFSVNSYDQERSIRNNDKKLDKKQGEESAKLPRTNLKISDRFLTRMEVRKLMQSLKIKEDSIQQLIQKMDSQNTNKISTKILRQNGIQIE